MNRVHKIVALIVMFCVVSTVKSQTRFTGWFMLMNTNKINKNFSTHFDFQLRSDDNWKNMETIIIRPGINYHLKNKMTATLGYAYIASWREIQDVRGALGEHRIWQQLTIPQPIGKTTLNHRFRLEERFVPRAALVNDEIEKDGTLYSTRFRYFFRSIIPIPGKQHFDKGFFTAIQNEVMVNITNADNVNNKFFDQNRSYLAIGWRLRPELDLETGYLFQYVALRNSNHISNNALQFAIYLRL